MRRLIIRIRAARTRSALIATQQDMINLKEDHAKLHEDLIARRKKLALKLAELSEAERQITNPTKVAA